MAYTNLPQNISYTGTPQDDGNLNLTPNLSAYNALTSMRNSAWAPSGVTPTIVPNSPEDLLNRRLDTYKNLSSLGGGTGVPSGMQITSPNSMSDRTPIPADYSNFAKTGSFSKDGINIAWQTPVSPVIRNQPGDVNGQYIEDTANPDALIKTERTPNSLLDRAIRAGRPGVDWQIDHIVPLALGGADTLQNRQLLSDIENDQKTKAQSVAYTLFAYGKLSQRDARNMAARWKDIDTSDIPEPDKYGMVPAEEGGLFSHLPWVKQRTALEVAQDAQKKWTEPKKVTVMDVIKGIPAAIPEGAKNFGEGWLPDPIREFVKGVASGGTLGFLPHEYTPEEGALSKITGTAGEILGSLAPWSRVAAFIKIPMAAVGLRKAYVYGNLAKEAPSFFKFFNPLTKEATALRAAAKPLYEKHLLETASVGGNAFVKGTIMGKPAAEVAADMIGTFKSTVPPSILRRFFADPSLREQTAIFSLASVAVGIASRTIATKLSPQILAGEEMAQDEKDTLKNIMKDLVFGAIPGAQSNTLKGTIYAASLPATLSWLSDPDNPLDALVNGAVFGAMHLHSSTRGFTKFDNFNDVEAIGGKQYNDPYLAAYDTAVGHGAHEILYTWNAGSKDIKKADPRGPVPIYTPEKIDSLVRSAQKNIQLALTNNDPVSVQKLRTLKKDLTSALAQDEYSPNNFGNLSQYVTAKGRATLQEKNATELERQGKINKAIEKSQKFRKGKEPSDPIGYETARKEMLRVVMAGRHLYKMGLPTTEGTVGKNGVIGKIRYREDLNDIFSMTAKQNEVRGDEIFKSMKTPDSLHYAAYAILKTNKGSILTSRLPSTGNIKDMTMITGGDENDLIEYQNALEEKRASPLLLFVKEPSYKYPLTIKNKYVPELYADKLAEGTASIDPHPETAIGAYALIAPKEGTKPNIVKLGYIASGYRLNDGLYAINKKHKGPGEFGLTKEVASKVMKQNGLDVMIMSHEMMSKEGIESGHAYIFAGMSPTSIEASKMLHQEMVKNGYVKPLNELVDNYNLSSQKNRIATDGPADAVSDKKDLIDHPERKTASQYIKTFPKGSKQEGHEIATKNIVDASAEVLSSAKTEEDVMGGLEKSLGFRIPITDARFLLQNKNEKGNNITTIPEINNIIQKTVSDPQNDVSPVAKRKADLMDNFIKSGAIRITSPIGDAVVEIPIVGNKPSEVPTETAPVVEQKNMVGKKKNIVDRVIKTVALPRSFDIPQGAVKEKTKNVFAEKYIPSDKPANDIGSLNALSDEIPDNMRRINADALTAENESDLLRAEKAQLPFMRPKTAPPTPKFIARKLYEDIETGKTSERPAIKYFYEALDKGLKDMLGEDYRKNKELPRVLALFFNRKFTKSTNSYDRDIEQPIAVAEAKAAGNQYAARVAYKSKDTLNKTFQAVREKDGSTVQGLQVRPDFQDDGMIKDLLEGENLMIALMAEGDPSGARSVRAIRDLFIGIGGQNPVQGLRSVILENIPSAKKSVSLDNLEKDAVFADKKYTQSVYTAREEYLRLRKQRDEYEKTLKIFDKKSDDADPSWKTDELKTDLQSEIKRITIAIDSLIEKMKGRPTTHNKDSKYKNLLPDIKDGIIKKDGGGGPGFHDGKGGIGDMWNSIKTGLKKTLDPLMPARRWEFVNPQPLDHPVKPIDQFGPDNLAKAIGSHETETLYDNNNKPYKPKDDAERYSYVQPFSKAIGYYQVEEPTLATYAPKVLGRTVTTEEFRNNRELQDLFARKYLEHLIKNVKLTPKQAVIAWNRGINGDPNSQDAKDYWDKVNRYLNYTGV